MSEQTGVAVNANNIAANDEKNVFEFLLCYDVVEQLLPGLAQQEIPKRTAGERANKKCEFKRTRKRFVAPADFRGRT